VRLRTRGLPTGISQAGTPACTALAEYLVTAWRALKQQPVSAGRRRNLIAMISWASFVTVAPAATRRAARPWRAVCAACLRCTCAVRRAAAVCQPAAGPPRRAHGRETQADARRRSRGPPCSRAWPGAGPRRACSSCASARRRSCPSPACRRRPPARARAPQQTSSGATARHACPRSATRLRRETRTPGRAPPVGLCSCCMSPLARWLPGVCQGT